MSLNLSRHHPHVVAWQIDDFADRFEKSILGDQWASDTYAFETLNHGRVQFHLKFSPKDVGEDNECSLTIRFTEFSPKLSIDLNCAAWLEDENETRIASKTNSFRLSQTDCDEWSKFLTADELKSFSTASTVIICVQLPYKVEKIAVPSVESTTHRWAIDDFATRFETAQCITQWRSDEFVVGGLENVNFSIWFYPKGERETSKDSCGLFLAVTDLAGRSSVPVQFELWLEGDDGQRTYKRAANACAMVVGLGWSSFMNQTKLEEFASKGPFSVCCTVRPLVQLVKPTSFAQTHGRFANLFNVAEVSDVEVHGKQSIFKVSKLILFDQSTVFGAMLNNPSKEQKSGVIRITDIDDRLLEAMLRFMYTGKVKNLDEIASDLLPVADRYNLPFLVKMCMDSVLKNLNVDRALDALKLAFDHEHFLDFKERVFDFAHKNAIAILELPEWKEFGINNPEILMMLLRTVVVKCVH